MVFKSLFYIITQKINSIFAKFLFLPQQKNFFNNFADKIIQILKHCNLKITKFTKKISLPRWRTLKYIKIL